jgi:hypothetical protein
MESEEFGDFGAAAPVANTTTMEAIKSADDGKTAGGLTVNDNGADFGDFGTFNGDASNNIDDDDGFGAFTEQPVQPTTARGNEFGDFGDSSTTTTSDASMPEQQKQLPTALEAVEEEDLPFFKQLDVKYKMFLENVQTILHT